MSRGDSAGQAKQPSIKCPCSSWYTALQMDILGKLRQAMVDLDDEEIIRLLQAGLDVGVDPVSMITDALSPGLELVGELIQKKERSVSDLVLASEIMNEAVEMLCPAMEARAPSTGEVMVIGNVQGGLHEKYNGKRIVAAAFIGAGYRVVDLGADVPASEFARVAKEHKATVVAASALGSLKPQCQAIHNALIDAGIRDEVIYLIGGWGINQAWCDDVGADAFGENAVDGLNKVKALRNGDLPRWRDRVSR